MSNPNVKSNTFTFTDEELQCLRVCLQNAPCPYDIGKKKLVSNLEDKIGLPIKPKVEPLRLPKYDLTPVSYTHLTLPTSDLV